MTETDNTATIESLLDDLLELELSGQTFAASYLRDTLAALGVPDPDGDYDAPITDWIIPANSDQENEVSCIPVYGDVWQPCFCGHNLMMWSERRDSWICPECGGELVYPEDM